MWLDEAKKLSVGRTTRVVCPQCNKKDANIYNNGASGYSIFCHRCGPVGYSPKGVMTLKEIEELKHAEQRANAISRATSIRLPNDLEYDMALWSAEARLWLYKAGIYTTQKMVSSNEQGLRGFSYSPSLQRVCLPVYDERGTLSYYQLRGFSDHYAKYVNPAVDKSKVWYSHGITKGDYGTIIVCEDILSAYRVGNTQQSMSILGTKVSVPQLDYLSRFNLVILWLDPDQAGIDGMNKISRQLNLTTNVRCIHSEKDPKFYSREEICQCLSKAIMN